MNKEFSGICFVSSTKKCIEQGHLRAVLTVGDVLLDNDLSSKEKRERLEKGVADLCNLSAGIERRGIEKGRAKGRAEGRNEKVYPQPKTKS